ncbi:acyl-CoA N-acyltransferase [Xylaria arbuscula]|nr:acyl-CoA N-acyltransferase [Xylaria arbuscula]
MGMSTGKSPNILRVGDISHLSKYLPSLQHLLQRCVNDDPATSSIGFLAPLSDQDAMDHWLDLQTSITGPRPENMLLVATLDNGNGDSDMHVNRNGDNSAAVIATVVIARALKQTHAYKGEIRKLLVHPDFRRDGLGAAMMAEAERVAREELGLELFVLDTAMDTPARRFYLKMGRTEWGLCPDYAMDAAGLKYECSFFFKRL